MPIPPKTRGDPGHHEDIQAEDAEELGQVAAFCRRVAIVCEAFQGAGNQCPLTSQQGDQSNARDRLRGLLKSRFFHHVSFHDCYPFWILTHELEHIGKRYA